MTMSANNPFLQLAKDLLCPPGNGVFTVHTAKTKKDHLHELIYQSSDSEIIKSKWLDKLSNCSNTPFVGILGIPSDCGGGILRGANWGPLAVRNELYSKFSELLNMDTIVDLGDIRVIPHFLHDKYLNSETIENSRIALYGSKDNKLPVSPLSMAEYFLQSLYDKNLGTKIFGIGGDHSVSYSLCGTYLKAKKKQNKRCALIHFDAHTDLLDKRLGVDICFGSWTYHMLKLVESPDLIIQLGIRSSGKDRDHWEKNLGVKQYWANQIISSTDNVLNETIAHLKKKKVEEVYISFDIDALDSAYANATGTPEPDGLHPHHAALIIEELSKHFEIGGADLVEVAPYIYMNDYSKPGQESTLFWASEIANLLIKSMSIKN